MGDLTAAIADAKGALERDQWCAGTTVSHATMRALLRAASPPSPNLPSREAIAEAIKATIKADATGLAPAVIGYHISGFEEAADAILALFTPPEPAPKPGLATVEGVER